MRSRKRSDKGFTLIEVVTTVVVLSILGGFTYTFIDNATKMYALAKEQGGMYQEASYMMERVARELRDAKSMCTVFFGMFSLCTPNASTYAVFERTNATKMDSKTSMVIYRSGDQLRRYSASGMTTTDMILGKKVSQFTVNRENAGTCNEALLVALTLTDGSKTLTLTTRVSPKNLPGPGANPYADRCFNGDYEDDIQ